VIGFFLEPAAGADPARNSKYIAERNAIELRGASSIGIAVFSDGAEIRGNQVSTTGRDSEAIFLSSSSGDIAGNVIRGTGNSAMNLRPFREMTASRNKLTGNDLRQFKAATAHILFGKGAADNSCAQNEGLEKVADQDSANRCR
jgi:hypothetical protein